MPAVPRLLRVALLAAAFGASHAAWGQVAVADAWVRGTVAGQRATGAFMTLTAKTDVALVAASSPVAKIVEIHEMAMDGSVMRMRAVEKIALPAGKVVDLKPGGYHVMLMELTQPLKEGERVPVTLTFVDRDGKKTTQSIDAPVRALTAGAPMPKH